MTMRIALAASLLLLPIGCATGQPDTQQQVPLEVRNDNFYSVVVYALSGGQRLRLGTVSGHNDSMLTIPNIVVGPGHDLRLFVDPVGSRDSYVSPSLLVAADQRVRLDVGASLSLSSVSVH